MKDENTLPEYKQSPHSGMEQGREALGAIERGHFVSGDEARESLPLSENAMDIFNKKFGGRF